LIKPNGFYATITSIKQQHENATRVAEAFKGILEAIRRKLADSEKPFLTEVTLEVYNPQSLGNQSVRIEVKGAGRLAIRVDPDYLDWMARPVFRLCHSTIDKMPTEEEIAGVMDAGLRVCELMVAMVETANKNKETESKGESDEA
jgi:hypothetical protein